MTEYQPWELNRHNETGSDSSICRAASPRTSLLVEQHACCPRSQKTLCLNTEGALAMAKVSNATFDSQSDHAARRTNDSVVDSKLSSATTEGKSSAAKVITLSSSPMSIRGIAQVVFHRSFNVIGWGSHSLRAQSDFFEAIAAWASNHPHRWEEKQSRVSFQLTYHRMRRQDDTSDDCVLTEIQVDFLTVCMSERSLTTLLTPPLTVGGHSNGRHCIYG